jgi:ATP-binding cassette subfamily F protein 3
VIAVQKISKLLGKKELFCDVSFHIRPGDRIGLIGTNGAGKTTLFQIMLGEMEPDSGTVTRPKSMRFGYLPQEWTPLEDKSVLAYATDVHEELNDVQAELLSLQELLGIAAGGNDISELALRQSQLLEKVEHLGGYDLEARAGKVLAGLGFVTQQLDRPVSTLSGGWAMRLELARLLLSEPELLLLDEPTNHLDLDSLLWLEAYLLGTPSAMVIVSHDRAFLDRVVNRILELEQGRIQEFTGNYSDYLQEKALRQQIQQASYNNQQERIRQIERFVERNRVRKDRARQAQSRMKQLEKIERIEAPVQDANIHFTFPEPPRSGKRVVELRNVRKAYRQTPSGPPLVIYDGLDLVIERGDRIAFLGRNGAGKSTLLKMLAGVEEVSGGQRLPGHQAVLGYYAQYQWQQLRPEWTVIEEASSVAGDMNQTQLRGLLGAFLFRGEAVQKKVSVLSGGEKARLILCKILLQRPNFLLLDEPTNHLDIPSREVLESALEQFPGAICFISHDRHFINRIANKILVVDSGRIHLFPGNYTDYSEIWWKRLQQPTDDGPQPVGEERKSESLPLRKDQAQKRMEAERRNQLFRLKKPIQDRLEELETNLGAAHEELESLTVRMGDPVTYQNGNSIQDLQKAFQEAQQRIERLTKEWEDLAVQLEEIEGAFATGCS